MKRFIMMLISLCILSTIDSANSQVLRRVWTDKEIEIWNLEYNYWKYVELKDNEGIVSLWNPKGKSWPNKEGAVFKILQNSQSTKEQPVKTITPIHFIPLGIKVSENCAYTMLKIIVQEKELSNETKKQSYIKVLHFWIKQKNKWQLFYSFNGANF